MRSLCALALCTAALCAAGEDWTFRDGSGWAGFKPGSRVKTRTSSFAPGGSPSLSVSTQTLRSVEARSLTIETITTDILAQETKTSMKLPASGEAGEGETASAPEALPEESLPAAGRTFACARERITVTGAAGKRIITTWRGADPKILVKRLVETKDAAGKLISSEIWLLTAIDVRREVGEKTLHCLGYKTISKEGEGGSEGEAVVCRDVPTGIVRLAKTFLRGGKEVYRVLVELLEFEAK